MMQRFSLVVHLSLGGGFQPSRPDTQSTNRR
jgi:hypothetical protein